MTSHWRFLELSLPTQDIAASLDFYRRLGFSEITTADIRSYPYAVVSDSRIAIGLHGEELSKPGLCFVQADAARWARQLEAAGYDLALARLGSDDFHEFALEDPSGNLAIVMEAPSFSRLSAQESEIPVTGSSACIQFACIDVAEAREFWRIAGLECVNDEVDCSDTDVELAAPALRLRLSVGRPSAPTLHFSEPDHAALALAMERHGLPAKRIGDALVITAPEGTRLSLANA